ncbi:MAG: winged helix-turn-helix transcriptional regulator, partial [Deltaproteobacteria bacterium]|nr:winged helix-turn-helix transcriptional regulator [Deltaproteobacteria bacterium]
FAREGYSMSSEQWAVCANLYLRQNGQFQQQLADRLYKDKAAITRLVHGLERRGLVRREEDRDDRRQKKIYLTAKGEALMQQLFPIAARAQKQGQKDIAPGDLAVFNRVLEHIYANANE